MAKEELRLKFVDQGFRDILKCEGTGELVKQVTDRVCAECNSMNSRGGKGFESSTFKGNYAGGRWVGYITATDKKSLAAASEDKVFERALHP